jgi:hypothetical protein
LQELREAKNTSFLGIVTDSLQGAFLLDQTERYDGMTDPKRTALNEDFLL